MTASSTTPNDLKKHDTIAAADTDTSNDLKKHDTIGIEKRAPAAEISADAFESPLQQAYQAGGWSSLDDPENPQNWSTVKKAYHAAIPSVYCFTVYVEETPVR